MRQVGVRVFSRMRIDDFIFSSRRRNTMLRRDWSSDVCSSDLVDDDVVLGHDVEGVVRRHQIMVSDDLDTRIQVEEDRKSVV